MTAMTATAGYADLLRSALKHVETDVPEAFTQFVHILDGTALSMRVADERFAIIDGRVRPTPPSDAVQLELDGATLLALIEGRVSLTAALAADRVGLIGAVHAIAAVDRALQLLLHGVLRSRAAPDLLHQLRLISPLSANRPFEEKP